MDRRTFLSRVLLAGPATLSLPWEPVLAASPNPYILLVDGVTSKTSATALFSFLDPVISQNIPVGIVLQFDEKEQKNIGANKELMKLLASLTTDFSGLVDIIFGLPDLGGMSGYFRMRAASDARNRYSEMLREATATDIPQILPQTIATQMPADATPIMSGLRTAGILNSILLPTAGSTPEIWRNSDGTIQVNGGSRLPDKPQQKDFEDLLSTSSPRAAPKVIVAALPDEPEMSDSALFERGAVIGDAIAQHLDSNSHFLTLPSDLKFRLEEPFQRHLVLCVETEEDVNSEHVQAALAEAGLSYSLVARPNLATEANETMAKEEATETEPHGCHLITGEKGATWQEARSLAFPSVSPASVPKPVAMPSCVATSKERPIGGNKPPESGFDVVLDLSQQNGRYWGVDGSGTLCLQETAILDGQSNEISLAAIRDKLSANGAPDGDVVLLVKASAFEGPEKARNMADVLSQLSRSGEFKIMDIRQFHSASWVKSEPVRLLKIAQRRPSDLREDGISPTERDLLMEDAEYAWSYFKQMTDPNTGLVPATAWLDSGEVQTYRFATMWDTGSAILAIVSAHSIGLISDDEFEERVSAALGSLASGSFNGLRLPYGLSPTDGRAGGDSKYNASDTARLLVSLHVLRTYASRDFGLTDIVNGWDLQRTIDQGVPQTVRGSRFVSTYRSNYAGYIFRAFKLWGFPVVSPYPEPNRNSQFDRHVEILQAAAELGPVGTEPHLLEAVELGFSEQASAVSEALYAAQVEEFLTTGKLACVSEGPINREPWFVYQGYQVGEIEDHWTAETLDPSPRFKTKGFKRAVDVLNTKAAFLWHVSRPGSYHNVLISHVRKQAKAGTLGFAPGVPHLTGKANQTYSDVNTNGVVLQAIAYQLNKRRPSVEWK